MGREWQQTGDFYITHFESKSLSELQVEKGMRIGVKL